jgi:hypothetical protein
MFLYGCWKCRFWAAGMLLLDVVCKAEECWWMLVLWFTELYTCQASYLEFYVVPSLHTVHMNCLNFRCLILLKTVGCFAWVDSVVSFVEAHVFQVAFILWYGVHICVVLRDYSVHVWALFRVCVCLCFSDCVFLPWSVAVGFKMSAMWVAHSSL